MTDPKRPPLDEAAREEMRSASEEIRDCRDAVLARAVSERFRRAVTPERVLALLDELVTPDEAAAIQRVAEVEELRREVGYLRNRVAELEGLMVAHGHLQDE